MKQKILTACSLLLLGGCSMISPRAPAPVEDASIGTPPPAKAPSKEESGVEIYAYGAPPTTAIPERPPVEQATAPRNTTTPATSAVRALLEEAEGQRQAADYLAAVATLERALRIEPRNPLLWNRLAWIRLEQGQYPLASSLAAKSSALAGSDARLKRENSEIIARARNAQAGSGGLR
ncbi:MAG TPA: hypothetical protein EYH03_00535 [Chromatiales bacterium]|nr:hypothetical protein [Chromatiales bacterium]